MVNLKELKAMKSIKLTCAAIAALLLAASCSKNNENEPVKEVKVNVTVADLQPSAKAIKTGWSYGDIINVYLSDASSYVPDFTLTYNGSSWEASSITDAEVIARLEAGGKTLKGFWEASNSALTNDDWEKWSSYIAFPDYAATSTTGIKSCLSAFFTDISFEYSGGVVTAKIDSWKFRGNIQIVVTGLPVGGKYCIYSEKITNVRFFDLTSTTNLPSRNASGTGGRIAGIANADGVAFVGSLDTVWKNSDFVFHLVRTDVEPYESYSFTKTMTEDFKGDASTIKAIKIAFNPGVNFIAE